MDLNDDYSDVLQQDAEKGVDQPGADVQSEDYITTSLTQKFDPILKDTLDNVLKITKKLVDQSKYNIKCPYVMDPTRIVVHNTANDAPAINEINYMVSNNLEVSFHFAVDDTQAVQGILLNRNAWHAGDGNGNGNRQGIGIEICYSKSGGDKFLNSEKNAAKLIAYLLHEAEWDIKQITKHQDYSGKYCPHRTLDLGWQRFLNLCEAELAKLNPPKEKFAIGDIVYNTVDLILEGTIYENATKALLPKNTKCKVYKYATKDSVLWIALIDPDGASWNAVWTKQLDKLTVDNPAPPLEKDEMISSLEKRIAELESSVIDKDNLIADLKKQISDLKK
ncbi:MAG: N-acetylmuramoyl-L-alanine amidase [Oscillospiraceae bacterium]|nr:N-acetylmuramoyl-L-alanine amidase [Oscillospiraceae bacterium]